MERQNFCQKLYGIKQKAFRVTLEAILRKYIWEDTPPLLLLAATKQSTTTTCSSTLKSPSPTLHSVQYKIIHQNVILTLSNTVINMSLDITI